MGTWEASRWAEVSPSCCRSQPICLPVTWMSYLLVSEHLYQLPDHPQQTRSLLVTQVKVLALPPQDVDLPPQVLDLPTKDPDLPPQLLDLPTKVSDLPPQLLDLPTKDPDLPPQCPDLIKF